MTNKHIHHKHHNKLKILFVVWLLWTGFGFWYFQFRWIRDFDPEQYLQEQFPDYRELDQQLSVAFNSTDRQKALFVITSDGCRCNRFIWSHVDDLKHELSERTEFIHLELSELPDTAQALIPSTPAAVIVNQNEQLEYFGPLNSGLRCTSESSYIETVLKADLSSQSQLNLISRGCYCPT